MRGGRAGRVASLDVSGTSAEAGGGRRVAAGAGHAPLVLLARGGGLLAVASGWAELGQARATGKFLSLSFCCFFIYSIISVTSGLY